MIMLCDETVPKFAAGVRFRFDEVRSAWVLLAPERLFQPDEIAVEILKLVDGQRTLGKITDTLAARYEAPRAVIAADVATMLQDLSDRGALQL
jgi:pyrroloquinoline quinone biosynthesis protein D